MRNRFQTSLKASQVHVLFALTILILANLPGLGAQNCAELLQRAQELLAQDQAKEALKRSDGGVSLELPGLRLVGNSL